jgi:hypothetical protein
MIYENFVNQELLKRGINSIEKLNIKELANAFDINVYYWNCGTQLISEEELYCIIDCKKDPILQYEEFLHELGHLIYMTSIENVIDLRGWKYLEGKVNYLVPYIAIPKFALNELKLCTTVYEASELFNITPKLVGKRLYKMQRGEIHESSNIRSCFN